MKTVKSPKVVCLLACLAISQIAFSQNTFPSSGNAGVGTTSPGADLEINSAASGAPNNQTSLLIHTGSNGEGMHQPSVKIINRKNTSIDYSPATPIDIFTVWREWQTGGGFSMAASPYFAIQEEGDVYIDRTLTVNQGGMFNHTLSVANTLYAGNDVRVSTDLQVDNNASINGILSVDKIVPKTHASYPTYADVRIGDYSVVGSLTNLTVDGNVYTGNILTSGDVESTDDMICHSTIFGDYGVYAMQLYASAGCYAASFNVISDKRFKKEITPVESVKEKLLKIQPYSYKFNKEAYPERKFDDNAHYGFIAQEVKEVFPNLAVKLDTSDFLAVNYTEFIPLLLTAIKEQDQTITSQQQEINELKGQLADLSNKVNALMQQTGINTNTTNDNQSALEQNVPNPFNSETRIRYSIAEKYTNAVMGVYDLTGKEIKNIRLDNKKGEIVLPARDLQPGIYIYSLVVDGKLISSKKMAITQ